MTINPPARANSRRRAIPSELDAATYRIPGAAARADISERTLWRLIDAKKVPGVIRFGKSVRISRKLFDAWIDGGAK